LLALDDVAAALDRGEAVNLKAPRMGGFITVLRALALVDARGAGALAYLGGMHETGVGREQARQLAAIYCPAAPNDLAPLPGGRLSTPGEVALDVVGFGAF
jgi:ABC-type iron transport system FetAB ATPase subunit